MDGARALIAGGDHREAVFWIAATFARCTALRAPAPVPGFHDLLVDLGAATPAARRRRARDVLGYLPRLRATAEAVLDANPAVRD